MPWGFEGRSVGAVLAWADRGPPLAAQRWQHEGARPSQTLPAGTQVTIATPGSLYWLETRGDTVISVSRPRCRGSWHSERQSQQQPVEGSALSESELARQVAGHSGWYHRIELAPGLITPGSHDSAAALGHLEGLGFPSSCRGLRVLDIGCRDGFFAFEAERRGGEVVALDYADLDVTGFSIAARALDSRVQYLVENVYDLDESTHGTFDVILFLGVLYHLRNPLLALDKIRAVHKPGGLLFVETQLATRREIASHSAPLWEFYPRETLHGDGTNKWSPNMPGLAAIIEECLYRVARTDVRGDRGYVRAVATEDERLAFFRALDTAKGWWGRKGVP